MHRGRSRIPEEIEKPLAGGQGPEQFPGRPVIEEEAGVQIIGKVDQKPARPFANLVKLPAGRLPGVLIGAFLPLPDLGDELLTRNSQDFGNNRHDLPKTAVRSPEIDIFRSLVLLDMGKELLPAIEVNRHVVLGKVRVVEPVAGYLLPVGPLLQIPEVFF